jgi:hypothetical protein
MSRVTRERRALPENLLRWMSKEERMRYGKGGLTAEEAVLKAERRSEGDDQAGFLNYCKLKGIARIRSRMDKRPTIEEGWPDFTCFYKVRGQGKTVFFEFKKKTKLSAKQEEVIALLRELGFTVHVVYTLLEAIQLAKMEFEV